MFECSRYGRESNRSYMIIMRTKALLSFLVLCFFAFFGTTDANAEQTSFTDANIKAVYILKIIDFVKWEEGRIVNEVCVVGDDLVGSSLAQIQRASKDYKDLTIERKTGDSNLSNCDVVFVSDSAESSLGKILYSLRGLPVLTVGDVRNFAERGGMVGFTSSKKKIKLEGNAKVAEEAGVKISSKLLGIAQKVITQ